MTVRELKGQGVQSVYIAGPMSGLRGCNFCAFDGAAKRLRRLGFEVVSPAELDDQDTRDRARNSVDCGSDVHPPGKSWADFLARDLKIVVDVDGIICLRGWTQSRGANLEVAVAKSLGKPVVVYPSLNPVRAQPRMPYQERDEHQ